MKLLKPQELADIFQTSKSTIYRWVHERKIPFVKIGGKLLFLQSDIEEYIKEHSISIL